MKKILITTLLIVLLSATRVDAFTATVYGYVKDIATRQPMAEVLVKYFLGYNNGREVWDTVGFTEEDGFFFGTIFAGSLNGYSFRAEQQCYKDVNWRYYPYIDYGETRYIGTQYMRKCCTCTITSCD